MADVERSSCCAPMRTVRCKRRGGRTRQLSRTADCWGRLQDELESDHQYKQKHREPYSFIDQMHRKFVKGGRSRGRSSGARLRHCDVCDWRGGTVRLEAAELGGREIRQRRGGTGARTLRRRPRTAASCEGTLKKLQCGGPPRLTQRDSG